MTILRVNHVFTLYQIALALALVCMFASPTILAKPVMWQLSDEDSTITLYPTVHLLPEGIDWQSAALTTALNEADEVWFEVKPDELAGANMSQLLATKGYLQRPLEQVISSELMAQLTQYTSTHQLPLAQLKTMQPWLLALTIMNIELERHGWSAQNGVESVLKPMAQRKVINGLESALFQIELFSDMSDDDQTMFLASTLNDIEEGPALLLAIAKAWSQGNEADMVALLIAETKRDYPNLYDVIFTQRNQKWVTIIETELAKSGSDFIAVGAGHLVGDDSVVAMLKAKGYTLTPIQ